jgi:hypothetical protein
MSRLLPLTALLALVSLAHAEIPELSAPAALREAPAQPPSLEPAPRDAARLPFDQSARRLVADLDAYHHYSPTWRQHVALDRPLYRPGDTVSVRIWTLATRGFESQPRPAQVTLIDPRGTTVQTVSMNQHGTLALLPDAPGGTWKVQLYGADGQPVVREFTVANFQAPRIEKSLEFARDGYGPGEKVQASVTLARATGEPLANTQVTARIAAGGSALPPLTLSTDARGEVLVEFVLPGDLQSPDVLLTVLVDDSGVTESISRPVPVNLDQVKVAFFPEGGDLVAGLSSRVYFEATDARGEPADVVGQIRDDQGTLVASLGSWVDGRGHVTFTPKAGRTYTAHVDRAKGEDALFPLPAPLQQGCVLHHHDDLEGTQSAIRVGVTCTDARQVLVLATQQEQIVDRAKVQVSAKVPTTVHLRSGAPSLRAAQGVARVSLLGDDLAPLAERLVFRNRSRGLQVEVSADRAQYAPGDNVTLTVRTRDRDGRAVPAEVSVAVVDDALLAFADDDADSLPTRVLLQADLPEPIEGAADWFDPESKDGGLALDLALGTRGWRRFDWGTIAGLGEQWAEEQRWQAEEQRWLRAEAGALGALGYVQEMAAPAEDDGGGGGGWGIVLGGASKAAQAPPPVRPAPPPQAVAPVRVFAAASAPTPTPTATHTEAGRGEQERPVEVRSDFRDTVTWQPAVQTSELGVAKVRFQLSDAVTGFRAIVEGAGRGLVGRGEAEIRSVLPLSVDARIPQQLGTGDQLLMPLVVENRQTRSVSVKLDLAPDALLALGEAPGALSLQAGERKTVYFPLTAVPGRGTAAVAVSARAGEAADALQQQIPVAPKGFPMHLAASGVLEGRVTQTVEIGAATEGSIAARVTLFPSTVSELTEGMEQMVRQPGGCFEQTSSTNYPNVVILDLLDRSGRGDSLAVDRQQVLSTGYQLLTGYQVQSGGFETFGQGPGKEALSAYGLLEFADMAKVYPVDPAVLESNVKYLYEQRDGKGGFRISGASAHGYGTAPPEVLDAYITYALVETGHTDLPEEIEAQSVLARRSSDPYRLALATLTLLETRPAEGRAAADRLAGLQAADGSFPGSETSITRSENQNLLVEATALSTMALLRASKHAAANKAVRWFQEHQSGAGVWGATQGNALALKALAEATEAAARAQGRGRLVVTIDGKPAGEVSFEPDQHEPVIVPLTGLRAGKHTVELALDQGALPYVLDVDWTTEEPASAETRRVDVSASLARAELKLGETDRLVARLTNRTKEVVPDPIARIGLPAGLEAQTWQLEQLVERGEIAFFETRPREVTLYWHGVGVGEVHEVALDLVAIVPGTFTGPASSAYPYYDDQAKAWAPGLPVKIRP